MLLRPDKISPTEISKLQLWVKASKGRMDFDIWKNDKGPIFPEGE